MSTISNLIFKDAYHKVTSAFGNRSVIKTDNGKTSSFHNGTDYGTNGKKIPQYAIEDGYVFAATKASDGALYVWVIYPRIKKAFLHYHLDSIAVKAGQTVVKGTKLGNTGMTGKSTGVHLHLGIRDLKNLSATKIEKMDWVTLRTCDYVDPEKVSYTTGYEKGTYEVTCNVLNVRTGAGSEYSKKSFSQLTPNAQKQIKSLNADKPANGLVKGCTCTVSAVKDNWGKIPSGWICLDYCEKV